mmetsp:Transcript_35893/g.94083  ORF Transcript_35893/g.94083 Transcript_35893/m.94083 type:complete len:350 (+) Transcript_35893:1267-2316(+)
MQHHHGLQRNNIVIRRVEKPNDLRLCLTHARSVWRALGRTRSLCIPTVFGSGSGAVAICRRRSHISRQAVTFKHHLPNPKRQRLNVALLLFAPVRVAKEDRGCHRVDNRWVVEDEQHLGREVQRHHDANAAVVRGCGGSRSGAKFPHGVRGSSGGRGGLPHRAWVEGDAVDVEWDEERVHKLDRQMARERPEVQHDHIGHVAEEVEVFGDVGFQLSQRHLGRSRRVAGLAAEARVHRDRLVPHDPHQAREVFRDLEAQEFSGELIVQRRFEHLQRQCADSHPNHAFFVVKKLGGFVVQGEVRQVLVVKEEERVRRQLHRERLEERDVICQDFFFVEVELVRDDRVHVVL